MSELACAVAAIGRELSAIYRIELDLPAERFLVPAKLARSLLPEPSPRSGLVALEEEEELFLGLYLDPRDESDHATLVEETSHLLCLAWHARQDRPVSQLILELQAEVDRYIVARLGNGGAFDHFERFQWDDWMDAATRTRYETAHRAGHRYCRSLTRRYPERSDVPRLLTELRYFYRASPQAKLRATS